MTGATGTIHIGQALSNGTQSVAEVTPEPQ